MAIQTLQTRRTMRTLKRDKRSVDTATALATLIAATLTTLPHAQTPPRVERVEPVTISAKAEPVLDVENADVGGFSATIAKTPQSITVFSADLVASTGAQTLSNLLKLDASLADSYNAVGYIESLSVRGFLLDQSANFRRNGLATSNYAPIALENKERVEILKGVAGLQSGVSAPGGLVNYVTKAPLKSAFTQVALHGNEYGGSKAQIDTNTLLGNVGVRANAAAERTRPPFDNAKGSRELFSVALAATLNEQTSLSADIEYHHKKQLEVPGLGLLDLNGDGVGETLPRLGRGGINPRLNLNNQSWSLPFESTTSSAQAAINHRLNTDWNARIAVSLQRSKINDRITFPDGCSNAVTPVYPGLCGNGDIDIYDFRSEGEKRNFSSWDTHVNGNLSALGASHTLRFGLSGHHARTDLPAQQAYNYVGTSNVFAPTVVPADATFSDLNTDSRERSSEGYASVQSKWNNAVTSFVGARVIRIGRSSERSDGSRAVAYTQTVIMPWAGVSYSLSTDTMLYGSWGQGVELEVVPNRPKLFANAGSTLPALKSKQTELGAKWQINPRLLATAALFSIEKPYADDIEQSSGLPLRVAGAKAARHRGIELSAVGRAIDAVSLQGSISLLDAKFTRASDPALIGQRVTNVPRLKTSLFADYKIAALSGFAINALLTSESGKTVNSDGSTRLPSAWQIDLGARYQHRLNAKSVVWRMNIENATNRTYWREAPTQPWGGVYLFPSTPRTVRASVAVEF